VSDPREERRELYVILALGGIGVALMYAFDLPYREGWMYWVGIPALTLAIAAGAWLAYRLFRRWRSV